MEECELAEEVGFDWISFSEHHYSGRIATGTPAVMAAAVAERCKKAKIAMLGHLLTLNNPVRVAEELGLLDNLTNGRVVIGFLRGTPNEDQTYSVNPAEGRGRLLEGMDLVIKALTEPQPFSWEGRYYQFRTVSVWPRPVQQPLPLWIGGSSEAAIRRTARIGTGWIAGIQTPAQVEPVVRRIREACEQAGRHIDPEHYGAGFSFRFGRADDPVALATGKALARFTPGLDPDRYLAVGGAPEILARLDEYRAAGVSKFVLRPMATDAADVMRQTERLAAEVLPIVHERGAGPRASAGGGA
jgi:alkanesulfonate monooxygenase SsuD/methylene tetrahydromethanopterin reductase-like flavin-dependent oxidoreductase (luciferase family)